MENQLSNIKERVLHVAKTKGISYETFFEKLGMTYGNFKGKAKTTPLNSDAVANILSLYPDVDPDWLISGKGTMIKEEVNTIYHPKIKERQLEEQSIPLYNLEAVAGLKVLFEKKKENILDLIRIPNLPKCDGAVYITGDSMYPLLKSGDIVLYKEINDIHNNIFFGEMYLLSLNIEGDEYITVKYLHKSEQKDYIRLVSYNQHHEPKDVPVDSIQALAIVKASIRMNMMR